MHDPRTVARRLASVYGHKLQRPLMYPQGVALSGRLRLAALDDTVAETAVEVAAIVAPYLSDPDVFDPRYGTPNFATACWADELYGATGDVRYRQHLVQAVDFFDLDADADIAAPLDRDVRVEDFFFAATLLGRAYAVTDDRRYLDVLMRFLRNVDTQRPDGLYWHCHASPFYWGRGNGFAALGFAEALTYLPRDERASIVEPHVAHLAGLRAHQDPTGMWRQIVDDETTYLEHSATTMIGCAMARGIRMGWLDRDEWMPVTMLAFEGAAERIGTGGELEHVCVGTGPLADRAAYVDRPFTDGLDDRGGAMALWFAVEVAQLQTGTGTAGA
ncbi:MAG: glycoside hydrolase family 88 protein [Gammaproteobacteria bacterium]|nr:glycoside hydrolase family 88 protein [Gammaproteobacteria bacterium]